MIKVAYGRSSDDRNETYRRPNLLSYDLPKRVGDVLASGFGLLLLSPLLVAVSLAVALKLGRPVLFAQNRPGLNERTFKLYKFRSMRGIDAKRGWVTNEQRMTGFGRLLRSTSLDELPSLWNVLRGDMSLVGPRPLRVAYLPRYSSEQRRRHTVRPGLTGLAQVRGRNALGWDERLQLDVEYVRRRSLSLDVKILAETVIAVFRSNEVAETGHATKSEFLGPSRTSRMELDSLRSEHLPTRVEWLNDPSVRAGTSVSFVAEQEAMEEWFDRVASDDARHDWVGLDRRDTSVVSMCGIQRAEDGHSSLYIYVDPARQGQGFGRDTMELLIARARMMGVAVLTLETPSTNAAAIRLYRALKFQDVGSTAGGTKRCMELIVGSGHNDA